jgi:hypothetical protein
MPELFNTKQVVPTQSEQPPVEKAADRHLDVYGRSTEGVAKRPNAGVKRSISTFFKPTASIESSLNTTTNKIQNKIQSLSGDAEPSVESKAIPAQCPPPIMSSSAPPLSSSVDATSIPPASSSGLLCAHGNGPECTACAERLAKLLLSLPVPEETTLVQPQSVKPVNLVKPEKRVRGVDEINPLSSNFFPVQGACAGAAVKPRVAATAPPEVAQSRTNSQNMKKMRTASPSLPTRMSSRRTAADHKSRARAKTVSMLKDFWRNIVNADTAAKKKKEEAKAAAASSSTTPPRREAVNKKVGHCPHKTVWCVAVSWQCNFTYSSLFN